MVNFIEILFLGLTAATWWFARRDLMTRLAQIPAASEFEALQATIAALTAGLEARAEAAEQRLAARIAEARLLPISGQIEPGLPFTEAVSVQTSAAEPIFAAEPTEEPRYAPVFALTSAGVTDPIEIARRTGLGRGEVELILGLRARNAI